MSTGSTGDTGDTGNNDFIAARSRVRRITWIGLLANLLLTIMKFAGGLLGRSQAVVADAVHSVSDMTTDIAILIGVKYWTKPADASHPHGHQRLETVITLSIGLVLAAAGAGLLVNAISSLRLQETHTVGPIALAAALISLVAKESLYRWTIREGKRIRSMPVIANAWHHRSDALSSIPPALSVTAALIDPDLAFLDQVGAALVALFIFQAAYKITRPAFDKLIDHGAPEKELQSIRAIAKSVEGVLDVHAVRTRYVGSLNLAVDLHIMVKPDLSVYAGHEIAKEVRSRLIHEGPDVLDVIVHIEPLEDGHTDPS
jgi:cation diffusion facilitator family transporter